MLSAHVQHTASQFSADSCVVGGVVVIVCTVSLQCVWHALDYVLRQNSVRVNSRLICGEGKAACHVTPPFPTKYFHGTIRNDGILASV